MKCPKCGYNSFEFLDACKKCNSDLSKVKAALGFSAFTTPRASQPAAPSPESAAVTPPAAQPEPPIPEAATEPVAEIGKGQPSADFDFHFGEPATAQKETETFSFDELRASTELPPTREETPQKSEEFSFDEFTFSTAGQEPPPQSAEVKATEEKEILAGFEWEGTSMKEKAPAKAEERGAEARPETISPAGPPEEFDLSAFSFEEPEPPKQPKKPAQPEGEKSTVHSDFDDKEYTSLFEEENDKK